MEQVAGFPVITRCRIIFSQIVWGVEILACNKVFEFRFHFAEVLVQNIQNSDVERGKEKFPLGRRKSVFILEPSKLSLAPTTSGWP